MNLPQAIIVGDEEDAVADSWRFAAPFVGALARELGRGPWHSAVIVVPRALFKEGSTQSRIYDRLKELGSALTVSSEEMFEFLANPKLTRKNVASALSDLVSRGLARAHGSTRARRYGFENQAAPVVSGAEEDQEEL